MPPEAFDALVEQALTALPDWVREQTAGVAFLVEEQPSPALRAKHGRLLGLYQGVPLTRRGWHTRPALPDTITLYRIPILRTCRDPDRLPERVATVLRHEIGHALGMSEARLRELGVA